MTQHHRVAGLKPVVAEVYIGTADARGDKTHQNFVVPRTLHFERFDLQRAAPLAQYGRLNPVHFHLSTGTQRPAPFLLLRREMATAGSYTRSSPVDRVPFWPYTANFSITRDISSSGMITGLPMHCAW
jgi:hypothetical protein